MIRDRLRVVVLAMRLSDDERERAVEALKGHYAAGRLSTEELEGHLERVYRPDARRDLAGSLGALSQAGLRRSVGWPVRRIQRWVFKMHLLTYLSLNASALAVWGLLGEGLFWPAILLIPSSVLLVWHLVASRALSRALGRHGW